ncbi:TPA: hypothetical protein ACH3X1_001740 [Trebouxia sp. C0004]
MTLGFGSGITGVAVLIWLLANVLCYAANENSWLSRVLHIPPLLCFTNGLKFVDPLPETFWCFDLLDPRDLVKSFWLGSRGLLLLRIVILIYLADILTVDGLSAAHGFERAYWMAYFTGWSFCLVITSTVLGVAVCLKYFITCHQLSRVVVHGRPGLVLHDSHSHHAADSVASTSAVTLNDLESGISPVIDQPALPASTSSRQSHRLSDTSWVMQAPVLNDNAAITRGGQAVGSQHAAAAGSFLPTESAFAKGNWYDPSDPEGMLPAELHYDSQLIKWSILEKVHCLVLQTAAVTSTAVLVFYWAVISGSGISGPYPDDYLKHAMNAPIMLLDAWFSKVPFTSYHLQVMVLYGSVYELFMWIYYGASDHWVYNSVTWHTDTSVAVYVLLPLAYVVLFFVWFAVATLRNYLGFYCGSQRLCHLCCRRCTDHVAAQSQQQEPLALAAGRLKKQSSNVVNVSPGRNTALTGNLDMIAHDTRYCGQQVLTTGRQTTSQSPDNPLLMELSRRGSAPRQV